MNFEIDFLDKVPQSISQQHSIKQQKKGWYSQALQFSQLQINNKIDSNSHSFDSSYQTHKNTKKQGVIGSLIQLIDGKKTTSSMRVNQKHNLTIEQLYVKEIEKNRILQQSIKRYKAENSQLRRLLCNSVKQNRKMREGKRLNTHGSSQTKKKENLKPIAQMRKRSIQLKPMLKSIQKDISCIGVRKNKNKQLKKKPNCSRSKYKRMATQAC